MQGLNEDGASRMLRLKMIKNGRRTNIQFSILVSCVLILVLQSNLLSKWILVLYHLHSLSQISPLYLSNSDIYGVKQTTSFHITGEL